MRKSRTLDNKKDALMHETIEKCSILYKMAHRPASETCMCWLWECGSGWHQAIADMSRKLEAVNYVFYPKFRVRIQMDQVKEKLAAGTFYYSVVVDPPRWMCIWHDFFQKIFDKIARLDFRKLEVLDQDAYESTVEEEIRTKEEFEKLKKQHSRMLTNVKFYERDGKFFKSVVVSHSKRSHFIATKHKLLHKLLTRRYKIENWPTLLFNYEPSYKQLCIRELVDAKARDIVNEGYKACSNACEYCGAYIAEDSKYAPMCTTRGYIQHLCQECADKTGSDYVMNGAIWRSGKEILSKSEYEQEKAEVEKRLHEIEENEESNEDET